MANEIPTDKEVCRCPRCKHPMKMEKKKCEQCGFVFSDYISLDTFFNTSPEAAPTEVTSSTLSISGLPGFIDLKDIKQKVSLLWQERERVKNAPSKLHFPEHVREITPVEVQSIIDDIQKCYGYDVPNACPGLLRKALHSAIKIRFLKDSKRQFLYDARGNRKGDLQEWIELAKQQGYLTTELARELKTTKLIVDIGVHDERIRFDKAEIADVFCKIRLAIEHIFAETP